MSDNLNNDIIKTRWNLYCMKRQRAINEGKVLGTVAMYNDELIAKLRTIYHDGIPASIVLLSNYLSNSIDNDGTFLMAKAFIDDPNTYDLNIVYAYVNSIKLNPDYQKSPEEFNKRIVLERITTDGKDLYYDTTSGLIFDADTWIQIENPGFIKATSKKQIINAIKNEKNEQNNQNAITLLPIVEAHYNDSNEIYKEKLQKEVELFKTQIKTLKYKSNNEDTK